MTPVDSTSIELPGSNIAEVRVEGDKVRIEFDRNKKNKDFDTLAYVFLEEENLFINAEILRLGYAHLQISPPNMKYASELREAYQEARREKRGFQSQ